jgi:magnesium transporter
MSRKKTTVGTPRPPRLRHTLHRPPPGSPPGEITAPPGAPPPVIRVMAYGPDGLVEADGVAVADLDQHVGHWPVTWVDVAGLGDVAVLEALGRRFGIHRLSLEDVANLYQRPKVEAHSGYYMVVVRQPWFEAEFSSEQICLFVGPDWVLSFQERPGDAYDPVRQRIRNPGRPIRTLGPAFLAYALVDAVLDAYFPILEGLGEQMEDLQDEIMVDPRPDVLPRIYQAKHALAHMRRAIWPTREMLNAMIRDPLPGMTEDTRVYLRDAYDHAVLALEVTESYRDMGSELMDFYLSSMSNRTNEIMKVLTITGTIFIPLTFIAGVYGMNFNPGASPWNMPELNWYLGYPLALGLMAAVAVALLLYFRRKGWIGRR